MVKAGNMDIGELTGTISLTQPDEVLQRVSDLTTATTKPHEIKLGEPVDADTTIAEVFLVPDGYTVHTENLERLRDQFRDAPRRNKGVVYVDDVDSFLTYWGKFANSASEIYWRGSKVIGVLNGAAHDAPSHADHRVVLELKHTPEFIRWNNASGKWMEQEDFAEFLHTAGANVLDPDFATMLEVAQELQATASLDFDSKTNVHNGQRSFKYMETIEAKAGKRGELEIPERILLGLRVFQGQEPVEVAARFGFRIGNPLKLKYTIDRIEDLLEAGREAVIKEIAGSIQEGIIIAGVPG